MQCLANLASWQAHSYSPPLWGRSFRLNALLAVAAGEAALVLDSPLVLYILISCHNWLEAALALGGVFLCGALVACGLVLGHKGLLG